MAFVFRTLALAVVSTLAAGKRVLRPRTAEATREVAMTEVTFGPASHIPVILERPRYLSALEQQLLGGVAARSGIFHPSNQAMVRAECLHCPSIWFDPIGQDPQMLNHWAVRAGVAPYKWYWRESDGMHAFALVRIADQTPVMLEIYRADGGVIRGLPPISEMEMRNVTWLPGL